MYIPAPLEIRIVNSVSSTKTICREVLGLTKMNWNNTEFDNSMPITIQAARRVGRILKYIGTNERASPLYSSYM